jgi:hypothetical protein
MKSTHFTHPALPGRSYQTERGLKCALTRKERSRPTALRAAEATWHQWQASTDEVKVALLEALRDRDAGAVDVLRGALRSAGDAAILLSTRDPLLPPTRLERRQTIAAG